MLKVKHDSVLNALMVFVNNKLSGLIIINNNYNNGLVYEAQSLQGQKLGSSPIYGEALNLILSKPKPSKDDWWEE
jgi:hypothetical protein